MSLSTLGESTDVDASIRPFHIAVPEADLVDLRRRITATRWPEEEIVKDRTQGVQLAKLRPLIEYWGSRYDWRAAEARFNAIPQFITEIDGLDIQFAHIRSPHPDALPLIMTHGWPGSVFELLKVVGPLTDPTAYGGRAEDAFHLVLPSLPGYGFSAKPDAVGWNPFKTGQAWDTLMTRLGYERYVSQGGDWGAIISQFMAIQQPAGLLGIHVNMPGTVPANIAKTLSNWDPEPEGLSDVESAAFKRLEYFFQKGGGYASIMNTRPQTLAYGLADSPVGQAAWIYDKLAEWTHTDGQPELALTYDEMLDDITLYWLTNTGGSSSESYWEVWGGSPFNAFPINIPVGVTVFPGEIYRAPRSWADLTYQNITYWNEVDRGGHFAAFEQPAIFTDEIRAAFRSLR